MNTNNFILLNMFYMMVISVQYSMYMWAFTCTVHCNTDTVGCLVLTHFIHISRHIRLIAYTGRSGVTPTALTDGGVKVTTHTHIELSQFLTLTSSSTL